MPESELVKIGLQGGSFALLTILFIWHIGWEKPAQRKADQERDAAYQKTLAEAQNALTEAHLVYQKVIADTQTGAAKSNKDQQVEHRGERREWREQMSVEFGKVYAALDRLAIKVEGCPHNDPTIQLGKRPAEPRGS